MLPAGCESDQFPFADRDKKLVQGLAVQGIQDIMMLEAELLESLRHMTLDKGTNHSQRRRFGKKRYSSFPALQVDMILTEDIKGLSSTFFHRNNTQRSILPELLAHRGFIRKLTRLKY